MTENVTNEELNELIRKCAVRLSKGCGKKNRQLSVLEGLVENGSMGQKEIQELQGLKAGSISEVITKLEEKGMIVRKKNYVDRRNVDIEITDAGRAVVERKKNEKNLEAYHVLTQGEKLMLKEILQKLELSWR